MFIFHYFFIALIYSLPLIGCNKANIAKENRCCFKHESDICCARRENCIYCTGVELMVMPIMKQMCDPSSECCVVNTNVSSSEHCINTWFPYTSSCSNTSTIAEWITTGCCALSIVQLALSFSSCLTENRYNRVKRKICCCNYCYAKNEYQPLDNADATHY